MASWAETVGVAARMLLAAAVPTALTSRIPGAREIVTRSDRAMAAGLGGEDTEMQTGETAAREDFRAELELEELGKRTLPAAVPEPLPYRRITSQRNSVD